MMAAAADEQQAPSARESLPAPTGEKFDDLLGPAAPGARAGAAHALDEGEAQAA